MPISACDKRREKVYVNLPCADEAVGPVAMLVTNCCLPLRESPDTLSDPDLGMVVTILLSHLHSAEVLLGR